MPGLDDETVKTEDELARRRVNQPWSRHIGVRPHHLRVEIGKENLGGDKRPLELGDAQHLEIADTRGLHIFLRTPDPLGKKAQCNCKASPQRTRWGRIRGWGWK